MILETLFAIIKPFFHRLDAETAHELTLKILSKSAPFLPKKNYHKPIIHPHIRFPNGLGLAAGFDKNAHAVNSLLKLGFGFIEIGTVTPKPQIGNAKPRLFRLKEDQAIINRMGFNNEGADIIAQRMQYIRHNGQEGIIGVNIGANKESQDRIADYALCAQKFTETASYFTVNVSSPNTVGLRDLQNVDYLEKLLTDVLNVAHKNKIIPVFLKIAPDQQDYQLDKVIDLINKLPMTGIIANNTTISRPDSLRSRYKNETGGLSGKPLFQISTELLKEIKHLLNNDKLLIGVGGINSANDAQKKIESGADALQIYSGLIYHGQKLINDILKTI